MRTSSPAARHGTQTRRAWTEPLGLERVLGLLRGHVDDQHPTIGAEGEAFQLTLRMSHRLEDDAAVGFGVSNPSRARWNLSGVPNPPVITIPGGDVVATTSPIRKPDDEEKDGDTEVTFVLDQPHRERAAELERARQDRPDQRRRDA